MHDRWRLGAFGLEVESDFPLPGARRSPPAPPGDRALAVRSVAHEELEPLAGEPRVLRYLHMFDGCAYAMLEGSSGDVLVAYGFRGFFHLSADRRVLRCASRGEDDPVWSRVLMDTVLWTASLLRGHELLHASAVRTEAGVLAFSAVSGGGKTSLAAEHLRRGALLFTDDVVALDDAGGGITAHPGPPVMNLPARLVRDLKGVTVLRDFSEEQWVAIDGPQPPAQPLAAIVLVHRAPGLETRCEPQQRAILALLPHAIGFPYLGRDRRRFEFFSTLAATTPVLRLTADTAVPAATLADAVGEQMARLEIEPARSPL
jgi:hypothetical protein